jgi:hypothetical protein
VGQVADIGGDDHEALAEFAGPGRLDGAVDRQHVGLDGDGGDGIDDLVDAPRHQFQILDLLDTGLGGVGRGGNTGDQGIDAGFVHLQKIPDRADLFVAGGGAGSWASSTPFSIWVMAAADSSVAAD